MQSLGLNEIRERFLSFFESKDHLRLKSFSLIPRNDKSLLIINSGMAPLKPYFTGLETPPKKRVTTCQKCIRTNDIDNVGLTSRHGTFFEMLGNFSFGDYFKEEIIPWSWEFLTVVMGISADRLFVSVYQDDDEAFDIWRDKVGLSEKKIFRMGKEDNFWEVGLGPCGPCSEIYYDRGEKYGCGKQDCGVGCDCDRFIEVWNLVFTQFNKEEDGSYSKLLHPNIDTGMGLERISLVIQDVGSIFDVDTVKAIRDEVCALSCKKYEENEADDYSIRVITDHIRSVTLMTADGIQSSNEGIGYILRRLLRRAARHGKRLGINKMFLADLAKTVIRESENAYPELSEKRDYIIKLLSVEEARFYETLDSGMEIVKEYMGKMAEGSSLSGEMAFKLYDTYGFPIELLREILSESGFGVDEDAFKLKMEEQRERGRAARGESTFMGADETVFSKLDSNVKSSFLGYDKYEIQAEILAVIRDGNIAGEASLGDEVMLITDKTVLYPEGGGQTGDCGVIETESGRVMVSGCVKPRGEMIAAAGKVIKGAVKAGQKAKIIADAEKRAATARNHSAAHLLQRALRDVLGGHVEQNGSYVSSDRLRFDFTHFSQMTEDELRRVEDAVNAKILEGLDVTTVETTLEDARSKGAVALFGEKYGELVRMVSIGDYSVELCGGTHLKNSAQAGVFKIISENGVSAGVRRIEALTGENTICHYRALEDKLSAVAALVKSSPDNILKRVEFFVNQSKDLNRELEKLRSKLSLDIVDELLSKKTVIGGTALVAARVDGYDMSGLREMGDKLRDKLKSGIIVLGGIKDEKAGLLCMITDDIARRGINAGSIIKEAAAAVGGSGGGKPNLAQAGIKDCSLIGAALDKAKDIVEKRLCAAD